MRQLKLTFNFKLYTENGFIVLVKEYLEPIVWDWLEALTELGSSYRHILGHWGYKGIEKADLIVREEFSN